jgi:hypothetical protein
MARRKQGRGQQPPAHDRTHLYRSGELPKHAQIAAVVVVDPYGAAMHADTLDSDARLEPYRHDDGTVAEGAPGWTPPPRPMITVVQSLKNDPLGHMKARGQIDDACFLAGREYQRLWVKVAAGRIRAIDLTMTSVDNSAGSGGGATDAQRVAAKTLMRVDKVVIQSHGGEALLMLRDVLGECLPVEVAARHRGAQSAHEIRWWGRLFRKGLDVVAVALGFANSANRGHHR